MSYKTRIDRVLKKTRNIYSDLVIAHYKTPVQLKKLKQLDEKSVNTCVVAIYIGQYNE